MVPESFTLHPACKLQYRDIKALDATIRRIVKSMHPDYDFALYARTFSDVVRLHIGDYPGYRASNTEYHDLTHTLAVTLACARLMHGAFLEGQAWENRHLTVGLLSALFHDVGYIQTEDDTQGTGAKYTDIHVERSVSFLRRYAERHADSLPLPASYVEDMAQVIRCTDLAHPLRDIPFSSPETALLGRILGSADLLAQMADELYVEKLSGLYKEFREAGIPGVENEYDLYRATLDFHQEIEQRLNGELGGVCRTARTHFLDQGQSQDLYAQGMDKNMRYIRTVVEEAGKDFKAKLRRGPERHPTFI